MKIDKASEKDLPEIIVQIQQEFPYVERTEQELREKFGNELVIIFKAVEGEELLGFIEIEFFEGALARINGLSVKESKRAKGIGKALLHFTKERLNEEGIERIILLVKQSNKRAKQLYEKEGFEFVGLYHRKLDNDVVEEMELDLDTSEPYYVS
ncbi:MAG: hypothetical protein CL943_03680 [Candidatus Diapherotrites archaeon]|uniref:N-acetyltransferase domain-containing protein n=1 Tax=Candidatus Iainarchaeum sp. TaxID=3101447 RepID=A0A2D6M1S0_9ARCH|nr:hypothetical protein [Candidatus Diapherotrites archaeon]|tara:strand:- start:3324 stop:3785 length:462 start_codon:yes stop_codon:yes gene_type:complete